MPSLRLCFPSGTELKYINLPQDGSNRPGLKHPLTVSGLHFKGREQVFKLDHLIHGMKNTGEALCIFIHY